MEDQGAGNLGRGVQPVDGDARSCRPRVAPRLATTTVTAASALMATSARPGGRSRPPQQFAQVAGQPGHDDLGLRVAEPAVVLEHLGPVGGEHHAGVEEPRVPDPLDLQRRAPSARRCPPIERSVADRRTAAASTRPCRRCWDRCRRRRPLEVLREPEGHDPSRPPARTSRPPALRATPPPGRSRPPRRRRRPRDNPRSPLRPRRGRATVTPLPAASPSALTTTARPSSRRSPARTELGEVPDTGGRGCRAGRHSSFAHAFEPSMRAASRVGPKTGCPRASSSSARPATRAPQDRRRSDRCLALDDATRPCSTSSAATAGRSPARDAGVPGAAKSRSTVGFCASRQIMACSRPPPPTTRSLMRPRGSARAPGPPRRPVAGTPTSSSMRRT